MAKTVEEAVEQQSYEFTRTGEAARKVFFVLGADSPYDAITTAGIPQINDLYTDADSPATTFVTRVSKRRCDNIGSNDDKHQVVIDYDFSREKDTSRPVNPVVDVDEVYVFEPTGDSVKILTVPNENAQTVYTVTDPAPDVGQYIGMNSDGSIDGVDVLDNSEVLTVTAWKSVATYSTAYQDGVRAIRNTVNSGVWYGAAIGEALFTGMRQVSINESMIELEYTFLISKNRAKEAFPAFYGEEIDPDPAEQIVITDGKKGWQYLWTHARSKKNSKTAYTELVAVVDVYNSDTYSALGLTGTR